MHSELKERVQRVEIDLAHDDIEVERVEIGRTVDLTPEVRVEDGVLIYPLVEEVVVTQVRLVLRAEMRISRRRRLVPYSEGVLLRRSEVTVERVAVEPPGSDGI